ncbi:MAG TPA: NAD kinase [Propionibacteriaceae bacterium]|nr:NAD kinase [Propionibacteriaceae bacterium]
MTSPSSAPRMVAVQTHLGRPEAIAATCEFVRSVTAHGIVVAAEPDVAEALHACSPGLGIVDKDDSEILEVVVVFGGDGTILKAAEWALGKGVPVLGVNLGHVGFLAELEVSDLPRIVDQVVRRDYVIERRLAISVELRPHRDGPVTWRSFAVNEVSIEKLSRRRMIEVLAQVDGLPVSRWGCDGLLVSTPTGSTAYAFSAGGPVMWPELDAYLMVPLSAHALFARPLVLGPESEVVVDLVGGGDAVLWCDGRRTIDAPLGAQVVVRRHENHLQVARLSEQPFTNRLVKKFGLSVEGFRNRYEYPLG